MPCWTAGSGKSVSPWSCYLLTYLKDLNLQACKWAGILETMTLQRGGGGGSRLKEKGLGMVNLGPVLAKYIITLFRNLQCWARKSFRTGQVMIKELRSQRVLRQGFHTRWSKRVQIPQAAQRYIGVVQDLTGWRLSSRLGRATHWTVSTHQCRGGWKVKWQWRRPWDVSLLLSSGVVFVFRKISSSSTFSVQLVSLYYFKSSKLQ